MQLLGSALSFIFYPIVEHSIDITTTIPEDKWAQIRRKF